MNCRSTLFEFTCFDKKVNDIVSSLFHSIIFNRSYGKFSYSGFDTAHYSIGTLGYEEIFCQFIDFAYIRVSSNDLVRAVQRDVNAFVAQLRSQVANQRHHPHHRQSSTSHSSSHRNYHHHGLPVEDIGLQPGGGGGGAMSSGISLSPPLLSTAAHTAAIGQISLEFFLKPSHSRSPWSAIPFTLGSHLTDPLVWEVWTLKFNALRPDSIESLFNATALEDQLWDKMLSVTTIMNSSQYLPEMPAQSELDTVFATGYPDAQPYHFRISYKIGTMTNTGCDRGFGGMGGGGRPFRPLGSSSGPSGTSNTQYVIKRFLRDRLAL